MPASDDTVPSGRKWAFVTPSYSGDFERCRLLCRSMDRFLTGPWHHYIVVDRQDLVRFRDFANHRRSVLCTNDVVPKGLHHLSNIPFSGGRSLWWSRGAGPLIGWHLQQFVKIGIANHVGEPGLAFCDSDVFFLKPFDVSALTQSNAFRLYCSGLRLPIATHNNPPYLRSSLELLDLPGGDAGYSSYVDNFVTWHRETVLALQQHLEAAHAKPWHVQVGKYKAFSEYTLYGLFVDDVQRENPFIFRDNATLSKTHWHWQRMDEAEVAAFCTDLDPRQVTVGVQSFSGVSVDLLNRQFELAASG